MSLTQTYGDATFGSFSFTGISVSETDVGAVTSFVGSTGTSFSVGKVPLVFSPYTGVKWAGFNAGALAPGSSTTLSFSYDVSSTDATVGINSLQQGFTIDTNIGSGLTLTAYEQVFDSAGHLVGSQMIDLNSPVNPTPGSAPLLLSAAYGTLHVQVTVIASVAANAPAPSQIGFSFIDQGFATTALTNQATLGDRVFLDANGNGVQDAGESGIAGVTVKLLDGSGNDTGLYTTTDANGTYTFANINAGTYKVQFVAPSGEVFTQAGQGTAATDSNAGSTGLTGTITLAAGQTDNTVDAGLYAPATFNVFVFGDVDASGTFNGTDSGLAGVTVSLLNGQGVATGRTAVTDATGHVSFTGLPPGSYEVAVMQPTGSLATVVTNVMTPVTLASGQTASAVAGYNGGTATHQNTPAVLSGHVFLDTNADGVQVAGDTNLSGITVQLLDGSGNPIAGSTAVTDANGAYTFGNLTPGSYAVAVVAPAGYSFSKVGTNANAALDSIVNSGGRTAVVTLAAGQVVPNQNAAVYAPATFTTHVYTDTNADGSQGTGETALAGVTVTLLTGAGVSTGRTAVTDANGNVSFTGLVPGAYQVSVTAPAGTSVTQVSNILTSTTLASGGTASAIEGVYVPASLSGHVFRDQNADGVQLAGDANLSGITVQLLDGSGTAIAGKTAVTDANGAYSFTGLKPGSYAVQVTPPAGNGFSGVGTNANAALDSIVGSTGKTPTVTLASGAAVVNQNAAVYVPVTITAHVYTDCNADGTQNAGDTNLAGVTVKLLDASGTPTGVTAVTDASGNVSFTGLKPGTYQIAVVNPANTGVSQSTNLSTPLTVLSGGTAAAIEGLYAAASLSGHVFLDQNADGVQLAGDTNLSGITVQLLDGNGTAIAGKTAVTDANGAYSFTGLKPGSYAVQVTPPAGNGFSGVGTNANAALDSIVGSTGKTPTVTLASGAALVNQNAAVYAPATFNTHIYYDCNADGTQNTGDTNVSGITVTLLDGSGNPTGRTAVTDANGNVSFTGLKPGTYQVAVTNPAGVIVSQATILQTPVTLTSGQTVTAIEGAYWSNTLSGHIFLDQNADGVQMSGDANLAGITVKLLDGSGNPIAGKTALTDANGAYSFTGLAAGNYSVQFTPPAGNSFSGVGTNANAALDSIVGSTGKTAAVALSNGSNVVNQNAAVYAPASLTAHVYYDTNRNGTQGSGEAAIAGVTVRLLNADGTPTGITAVTDANGNASFIGLKPGTYQMSVVNAAGVSVTQSTNLLTPLTLVSGSNITAIEGIGQGASLSGKVFVDSDRSGTINTGDTNLAGQKVQLLNSSGVAIAGAVTTTDASGAYSFTGLAAGTYSVAITGASGYAFTTPGSSTNTAINSVVNATGKTGTVTLGAGQSIGGLNAGEYKVTAAIVVDKTAALQVVRPTGTFNGTSYFAQDTYTYRVTNTGTQALTNVQVLDNHGSAAIPDYITPTAVTNSAGKNVGDANSNGLLDVGESWSYTATLTETGYIPVSTSTIAASSFNNVSTKAGSTIWLNASIKNYSTASGTSYAFKGLTATITVPGMATPYIYHLPDSYVTFSSAVATATTRFDSVQNAWVTVAPAGQSLGNVFMTGEPIKVPAGVDFKNASVVVSMAQATSTSGAAAPQWQWGASNYSSFSYTDDNGKSDYNLIGVKPCDAPCSGFSSSSVCGAPEQVMNSCGSSGNVTGGGTCAAPPPAASLNCWNSAASCGSSYYNALSSSTTRSLGSGTWTLSDSSGLNVSVCANNGSGVVNQIKSSSLSSCGIGIANGRNSGILSNQWVGIDCGDMRSKGYQLSSVGLNGLSSGQTGYVWGSNDGGATYKLVGSCDGSRYTSQGTVTGCDGYTNLIVSCSGSGTGMTIGQLGVSCIPNYCGTQSSSANVNLSAMTDSSAIDTVTATASTLSTTTTSGSADCSSGWNYGNSGCYYGGDDDSDWRHQGYSYGSDDYNNYYCSGYSTNAYSSSCNYNYCGTQTTTTTVPGSQVSAFDTANVDVLTGSGSIYVAAMAAVSDTVTLGAGRDAISLFVTEDYYLGNAQFTISVDGTQIGGVQTATTLRSSGLVQQFKVLGNFSGSAHTVSVNFLNDNYAGTTATDRNLYVAQASENGTAITNAALSLAGNGAQSIAVQSLDTLSLSISQDAYLGNAQFTISVDGNQVGGVQSTAALKSLGASQQFMITGKFASGTHTVSVNFLNDSYAGTATTDRNLYVNQANLNGNTINGASLSLMSTGAQSFTFQGSGSANSTPLTLNAADYTPVGSLSTLYGTANKLEFVYTPSDTVSSSVLSAGLGTETGTNTGSMAFIEISSSADAYDPNGQVFYAGNLAPGAKLFADATTNLSNVANPSANSFFAGSNGTIFAHVFASENDYLNHAASAQELTYRPGAGGLQIGDQIGSLKLIGYVGTTGQGYLVA